MTYYKVIVDEKIIDVNFVFLKWQAKHKIMLSCDASEGQFIQSSDCTKVWRVGWLCKIPEELEGVYESVTAVEIDEEEYKILREALDLDKDIEAEDIPDESDELEVDESKNETLEFVKDAKIRSLSKQCNANIIAGFDVTLSDGSLKHIDMQLEDQVNVIALGAAASSGTKMLPYNLEDDCIFLTKDDMNLIYETGMNMKTAQLAYYHSLKKYVESMQDIEDVRSAAYGMEVPQEFWTVVYASIMGGVRNESVG